MIKRLKKVLISLLTVAMTITMVNTINTPTAKAESNDDFYKIVHLDAGRKYFSPENIKAIIDTASEAGYNQVELYLSDNQGFRFALDDMTITTSYGSYNLAPALGDGYSDGSKYPDGSGKYLTQTEMTDIISYAKSKGIEIVPCINVPGHMGAILEAFPQFKYSGSKSSIDLENGEAVAFALAITEKYAEYFAGQGVKFYNLGADEYANDMSTMGFQGLYTSGKYQNFVNFLNSAAEIVIKHGMTPRAFNDGICYNNDTSYDINKSIQVCYWSSGWNGYNVASAATLSNAGYDLINTHGDYYWVLGNSTWQCSAEKASGFDYKSFQGGTVSNPAGAMFCIWCDNGAADGQDDGAAVVSATKDVIAAFGDALPKTDVTEKVTVTCPDGIVSVTAKGLTSLDCKEVKAPPIEGAKNVKAYDIVPMIGESAYTDEAIVSIKVPEGWNTTRLGAFVVENDESITKITGSYANADGVYTYIAPHFSTSGIYESESVDVTSNETITVTVGGTETATIDGENYAGTYTTENPAVATVVVTGKDATEATTTYTQASATCNNLISSNRNNWKAVSDYYYKASDGNYYPLYAKRSSSHSSTDFTYTYTWGYSTTGFTSNVTQIETQETTSKNTTANITVYTKSDIPAASASTTVTFTGKTVGTTYVNVGDTRYTINVVAEDLSKVTPLSVEYWITNLPVTAGGVTSTTISAQRVYSETGVDISTLVPETGSYTYGSVVFWKGTVLDANNKQTSAAGVENDKTGAGKDFSLIRYYDGNWQYFYDEDGAWHTISSTDQVVIYWLQPTEVTQEITTLVKDWGYAPDNQGNDTASKVALTVAVVYPDGTVSPAEGDMYSKSTTLFNYWDDRNIGLVAPVNNSDYEISKITVTNGKRDQSGTEQWGASDTITWEKVTNDAGENWYNETTYWTEANGGTPMVNGLTSGITWSNYNTAKLVLIYLKPVHYDTNLVVNWVDDSAGGSLISTMEVAVSSDGTPITFYNGLKQNSALPTEGVGGTFTLDDNAYVTNSSNVNQTFNKKISTVPGAAEIYKSGLYTYVSADLSADGKTLTLHYDVDSTKLSKQYVIDFGLPVNVPLSDLVENYGAVKNVQVLSDNAIYNSDQQQITYTPSQVLTGIEAVSVHIEYDSGDPTTIRIGFVPATTVYYEEGFATLTGFTGGSKGTELTQAAELVGEKQNVYGYDSAYIGANHPSANTQATSDTQGNKAVFTFTGTGVGIYANCDTDTGKLFIQVKGITTNTSKIVQVKTALVSGETDATSGQNVEGYNVPIAVLKDLPYDSYTVTISHVRSSATEPAGTVNLDGFRVYGTLDYGHEVYQKDNENNPTFVELRDKVLAALNVNIGDSIYANQIAQNTLAQVYATAGDTNGAVIIDSNENNVLGTNDTAQDLLDNGPKNEIYLRNGQSLVFKLKESVTSAQIGMRALNKSVNYTINGVSGTLNSSTDMFYELDMTDTITITNNGDGILAITDIKAFGVTEGTQDAMFMALSAEDFMPALLSMGFEEEPTAADANLNINVVDVYGNKVASTSLVATGAEGETAEFAADDIIGAVNNVMPAGYAIADEGKVAGASVAYGDNGEVTVTVGKIATLTVQYKKMFGKSISTVTLTKVQTDTSSRAQFTAAEIRAAAPKGYYALNILGSNVKYGYSSSRTVYVY